MYLILDFVTKALVTNLGTAFRLRCCLHSQSMCTQTEPTNVTQNMFGRIKMKIPWHIYFSLKRKKLRRQWQPLPTWIKERSHFGTEYRKAPPPRKGKKKKSMGIKMVAGLAWYRLLMKVVWSFKHAHTQTFPCSAHSPVALHEQLWIVSHF
jgi:hypothetical protein